jgi:Right handed beta helix region
MNARALKIGVASQNARRNLIVSLSTLLLGLPSARAVDFHAATAQDLQSDLFLSAENGVNNNIYVASGYYLDTGSFHYASSGTNSLTLLAEPGVASSAIVLDSGGSGKSLNIACTAPCQITVQGMTFLRNCGNGSLGGLQIDAPGSVILVNGCQFLSPTNSSGAGLVITSGKNVTVTNCIATGITNGGGTGIFISGVTSNVTVQSCTMTTNLYGAFSSYTGIGLEVSGSLVIAVTNCVFTGNSGGAFGGGAYLVGSSFYAYATIINLSSNIFTGNSTASGSYGGGVCCSIFGTNTLSGNVFTGNSAGGGGAGGGVYCDNFYSLILSGNTFTSNSGANAGGGAYCADVSRGVTLTNNTFTGNSSTAYGGGFYCSSGATNPVTIFGNTFQNNSAATDGGGFYVSVPNINLLDNLVINNAATNHIALGGGIWVDASTTLNMINNTVTGNSSAANGGGVAYIITGTVEYLNIYNNIIWGNSATSGGDVYLSGTGKQKIFSFNDVHSQSGPQWDLAQGLIDLSPQFLDSINGNYHLQSSSPCIAAGSTSAPALPATDLDGNPRTDNGTVDMGCYEFTASVTPPADVASISRNANGNITLDLVGTPNATNRIWATTNLANPVWIPVSTNILIGGTSSFSDPQSTNYPGRYYRISSP